MEFTIDCRSCPEARSASCDDCVVTFISSREPDEAVVVDVTEFAAIRRLMAAGLVDDPTIVDPATIAAETRRDDPPAPPLRQVG